jgi:hypothetical protein
VEPGYVAAGIAPNLHPLPDLADDDVVCVRFVFKDAGDTVFSSFSGRALVCSVPYASTTGTMGEQEIAS